MRRILLMAAMACAGGLASGSAHATAAASATLAALERRHGGRLGVVMLDPAGGLGLAHRAGERFAMCSTVKLMLAAATLAQVDAGRWRLGDRLTWTAADHVPRMPATAEHNLQVGMTLAALAESAQRHSDNLAANCCCGT